MNVEKIVTKKVSESVAEQIEQMIEVGNLKAGEKLPSVRELCELFGVGRTAVRDAITTLKGKGMVDVKQGEGTYICKFDSSKLINTQAMIASSRDIEKLFQVRKVLEVGIVEMAAVNRSTEDLRLLEEHLFNVSANSWESDYLFHLAIAKATKNDILIQLIEVISASMKKTMMEFHCSIQQDQGIVMKIGEQHKEIYQSINQSNPKEASMLMLNHLAYVEELLQCSKAVTK